MDDLVKRRHIIGTLRIFFWSAALAAGILLFDRILLGPLVPVGWQEVAGLSELSEVSVPLPPPYLPSDLSWPPHRIFHRKKPQPGWFLGFKSAEKDEVYLWIGASSVPLPGELEDLASCMGSTSGEKCPFGWRFASAETRNGALLVFSRLGIQETKRILLGFEFK